MTATAETYHRFVLHHRVQEYLQIGWMALPSLEATAISAPVNPGSACRMRRNFVSSASMTSP